MSPWRNVRVSGGFCLLTAWFALANGLPLLGMALGAALIHEAGHWAALRLLGGRVTGFRVTVFGVDMALEAGRLSYGRELAAVLAGPAVNLLLGGLLARGGWQAPAGVQLALGLFNLLPARPLDGGKALYLLVSWAAGPTAGAWAARWIGGCAAMSLATCLVWLMWNSGGSLWLAPPAAGLLAIAVRELLGKENFL